MRNENKSIYGDWSISSGNVHDNLFKLFDLVGKVFCEDLVPSSLPNNLIKWKIIYLVSFQNSFLRTKTCTLMIQSAPKVRQNEKYYRLRYIYKIKQNS